MQHPGSCDIFAHMQERLVWRFEFFSPVGQHSKNYKFAVLDICDKLDGCSRSTWMPKPRPNSTDATVIIGKFAAGSR